MPSSRGSSELTSPEAPALQADSLALSHSGKPMCVCVYTYIYILYMYRKFSSVSMY